VSDLDVAAIERELERLGATLGRPVSVVALSGSTNDDARSAAAEGAPHGATFIADAQSRGRGRGGHVWHSPPGENLYLSVVLRPRIAAANVAPVALVCGLVVARVVERRLRGVAAHDAGAGEGAGAGDRGTLVGVKWPNDVMVAGKKVSGVLVEARLRGVEVASVVAGVGVNVRARSFPPEIVDRATSLALLGAADLDRSRLAAELLAELGAALLHYEEGGLAPFLGELAGRDVLRGGRVEVGGVCGVAAGIDAGGQLCIRQESGVVLSVAAGEVTIG
jgi:BirA family biotin operon repressor/biotin-[acetyl-CoA-carboxylase] ligase